MQAKTAELQAAEEAGAKAAELDERLRSSTQLLQVWLHGLLTLEQSQMLCNIHSTAFLWRLVHPADAHHSTFLGLMSLQCMISAGTAAKLRDMQVT